MTCAGSPGGGRTGRAATSAYADRMAEPTTAVTYLLVTGLIAVVVHRKLGLRMLGTMWINLDLIWGGALLVTGAVALLA